MIMLISFLACTLELAISGASVSGIYSPHLTSFLQHNATIQFLDQPTVLVYHSEPYIQILNSVRTFIFDPPPRSSNVDCFLYYQRVSSYTSAPNSFMTIRPNFIGTFDRF